jgi:heme/copper-type cytochrome/quinol oxidase subunit 2
MTEVWLAVIDHDYEYSDPGEVGAFATPAAAVRYFKERWAENIGQDPDDPEPDWDISAKTFEYTWKTEYSEYKIWSVLVIE